MSTKSLPAVSLDESVTRYIPQTPTVFQAPEEHDEDHFLDRFRKAFGPRAGERTSVFRARSTNEALRCHAARAASGPKVRKLCGVIVSVGTVTAAGVQCVPVMGVGCYACVSELHVELETPAKTLDALGRALLEAGKRRELDFVHWPKKTVPDRVREVLATCQPDQISVDGGPAPDWVAALAPGLPGTGADETDGNPPPTPGR